MADSYEYKFRFIVIGDSGIGKTALLNFFGTGKFKQDSATIGVDITLKTVQLRCYGNTKIQLELVDTAGQERFRSISSSYYRMAIGVLLVYDMTDQKSFESIPRWMEEVNSINTHSLVFALVGCKSDLPEADNTELTAKAMKFAKQNKMIHYETSSNTGLNVDKVFTDMTTTIYSRIKNGWYKFDEEWQGIKHGNAKQDQLRNIQPINAKQYQLRNNQPIYSTPDRSSSFCCN